MIKARCIICGDTIYKKIIKADRNIANHAHINKNA